LWGHCGHGERWFPCPDLPPFYCGAAREGTHYHTRQTPPIRARIESVSRSGDHVSNKSFPGINSTHAALSVSDVGRTGMIGFTFVASHGHPGLACISIAETVQMAGIEALFPGFALRNQGVPQMPRIDPTQHHSSRQLLLALTATNNRSATPSTGSAPRNAEVIGRSCGNQRKMIREMIGNSSRRRSSSSSRSASRVESLSLARINPPLFLISLRLFFTACSALVGGLMRNAARRCPGSLGRLAFVC
jgi:hypothetical protein